MQASIYLNLASLDRNILLQEIFLDNVLNNLCEYRCQIIMEHLQSSGKKKFLAC